MNVQYFKSVAQSANHLQPSLVLPTSFVKRMKGSIISKQNDGALPYHLLHLNSHICLLKHLLDFATARENEDNKRAILIYSHTRYNEVLL